MGDFGIAQIYIRQGEMGKRLPFLAVPAGQNAYRAIRGNMGAAFAENADPLIFVAYEVREGAMRSRVPDTRTVECQEWECSEKEGKFAHFNLIIAR